MMMVRRKGRGGRDKDREAGGEAVEHSDKLNIVSYRLDTKHKLVATMY